MLKGNEIIYQVFVRNYSNEGTFQKVSNDLPRLKELGVDILYLMPIHEIGVLNRKGTWGSPYAIKDYYSITEDYGSLDDFKNLINKTHSLKMKIIIDIVFNHTSPDSILFKKHPEFFFYRDGRPGNRVGDWTDIIDLDTSREDVQNYLLDVLKYWISVGVDGFRFDVASIIDLNFFKKARKELGPEVIFFGESIDYDFVAYLKSMGYGSTPDIEMFPTFDALYNYSWYRVFEKYMKGYIGKDAVMSAIKKDEELMGDIGMRVNCLENHDNDRIAQYLSVDEIEEMVNLTAHLKGPMFIYMGQEYGVKHRPNLFEKDPVIWEKDDKILSIYQKAIKIKKAQ